MSPRVGQVGAERAAVAVSDDHIASGVGSSEHVEDEQAVERHLQELVVVRLIEHIALAVADKVDGHNLVVEARKVLDLVVPYVHVAAHTVNEEEQRLHFTNRHLLHCRHRICIICCHTVVVVVVVDDKSIGEAHLCGRLARDRVANGVAAVLDNNIISCSTQLELGRVQELAECGRGCRGRRTLDGVDCYRRISNICGRRRRIVQIRVVEGYVVRASVGSRTCRRRLRWAVHMHDVDHVAVLELDARRDRLAFRLLGHGRRRSGRRDLDCAEPVH